MAKFGRRRGDGLTYLRGSGSLEVEVANMQSAIERIDPALYDVTDRVDSLESDRDSAKGMLKVIAVLQGLIILLLVALFSWGLNHMEFHSSYERTGVQSKPTDSGLPSSYVPR